MLCFGFSVWPLQLSCAYMVWFGTQNTMASEKRPYQKVKTAHTVQMLPGFILNSVKVLTIVHQNIQSIVKAIHLEGGIGTPNQK